MPASLPPAVLLGNPQRIPDVYPPALLDRLRQCVALAGEIPSSQPIPAETEILLGTWGMPLLDEAFLQRLPNLRGVFYGAGTIRGFVTEAFWDRQIPVVSAAAANAVPVVDYTVSVVLLGLKRFFYMARTMRERRRKPADIHRVVPGNYGALIGLVSFGKIARMVAARLIQAGCRVQVYDPFLSAEAASESGVELCTLERLFSTSDIVSVHAPNLPETRGLLGSEHFNLMRNETTFINTARGAVVREPELVRFLAERPDVQAVLDVTLPEPPETDSPLYELPNVILTPHIAGSLGRECGRMGELAVEEVERFLRGEPLQHAVTREQAATLA